MMINEAMEEWHRESLNTTDIKYKGGFIAECLS